MNLVPVFLVWQRFSFVPKRMVSKLIIFKFIKELNKSLKSFRDFAHL